MLYSSLSCSFYPCLVSTCKEIEYFSDFHSNFLTTFTRVCVLRHQNLCSGGVALARSRPLKDFLVFSLENSNVFLFATAQGGLQLISKHCKCPVHYLNRLEPFKSAKNALHGKNFNFGFIISSCSCVHHHDHACIHVHSSTGIFDSSKVK